MQLTNDIIRSYVEYCGHPRPADGKLHLLGLRACRRYPNPEEKVMISLVEPIPNSYDDLLGCFGRDLAVFPGTVDPGLYYSLHPLHPRGCAHLVGLDAEAGKPYTYTVGTHKRTKAFVQGSGVVTIWRDYDRNMVQGAREQPVPSTGNGINIHRMGTIRKDIGKWSAGCPGVMDQYWDEFWRRSAVAWRQPFYLFYLLDAWQFAEWFDNVR
jgi:hypothetical protein